jgi:hypothetical protein
MTAASLTLLQQLLRGGASAVNDLAAHASTSDDVAVLVAAALFSQYPDALMAEAAAVATTPRQRELLAVATAHLAGDADRVDVLAREHLAYHPDSVLVAWISALSNRPDTTPKEAS